MVVCGAHHHRVARHADGGCQLGRVFRRGRVDGSGDGEDVAQHEEGAHTGTDQGIAQSGLDGAAAQVCAQQHACQRNGERVDEEADGAEGKGRGGEVVIGEEVFVVEQRAGEQRVEQRGEGERGCATGEAPAWMRGWRKRLSKSKAPSLPGARAAKPAAFSFGAPSARSQAAIGWLQSVMAWRGASDAAPQGAARQRGLHLGTRRHVSGAVQAATLSHTALTPVFSSGSPPRVPRRGQQPPD